MEDNRMNEKADANSIEPNTNMLGESTSKSKSNQKNKGKAFGGSGHKSSKDGTKDYTQQSTTTSRKFIIVGSVENLSIKLRIVTTRKSMEAEIMEEIPTKQTMCYKAHLQFKKDVCVLTKAKNIVSYRFLVYQFNVEDISNNTIIESAEAEFLENTFPYKDKDKQISIPRKRVLDDQLSHDQKDNAFEVPQENVEPRRSKRAKITKDFRHDFMTYIVNEEQQTYKAAMESSEEPYWIEAIQSEIYYCA
ncbi:hypothetical protein Tco_1568283 [Tanacetum coccineum]